MATYEGNCYEILEQVRYGINEHSTAYVQGTDTSGTYQNPFIIKQINDAQLLIYNILLRSIPDHFLQSSTITGVSSVFTLPWDFGTLVQFRDPDGYPVAISESKSLPVNASLSGSSDRIAYRKGNTLVLFKSGVNETYTLWYRTKPRLIHAGKASAGAATSITLNATYAKRLADYYNGMKIENVTDTSIDTITDYTAALVATISGTGEANDYYGIVSELPEAFHHLIASRATMLCRDRHPVSEEKTSKTEFLEWQEELRDALIAFGKQHETSPEDIWIDYGYDGLYGVNIPGQGYLIY
jgi:hypothetical protein